LSFRRKPESSYFKTFWTPAFAGVTTIGTFYEIIKIDTLFYFHLTFARESKSWEFDL